MYSTDFDEFKNLISDLCTAHNVPLNDDRVRVFWEALKAHPLPTIRARARFWMGEKKFPKPADLAPPKEKPAPRIDNSEQTVHERLVSFVVATKRLTPAQLVQPWKFLGEWVTQVDDQGAQQRVPVVVGVVVPADGDAPGYRVMVQDMQLERAAA